MSAKLEELLSRLQFVKQTKPDQWIACCPAHDDSSPSLNITLASSGNILIKCWAGCGACDVIQSVGMSMSDLFPDSDYEGHRRRFNRGADFHSMHLLIAQSRRKSGHRQSKADKQAELESFLALRGVQDA